MYCCWYYNYSLKSLPQREFKPLVPNCRLDGVPLQNPLNAQKHFPCPLFFLLWDGKIMFVLVMDFILLNLPWKNTTYYYNPIHTTFVYRSTFTCSPLSHSPFRNKEKLLSHSPLITEKHMNKMLKFLPVCHLCDSKIWQNIHNANWNLFWFAKIIEQTNNVSYKKHYL